MADATFTHPEVPGVTFTLSRGDQNKPGRPGNWMELTAHSDTDVDEEGNPIRVLRTGFVGL